MPPAGRRGAGELFREIAGTLAAYIRGQLIVSAILTAIYAVAFALLRMPLWFVLAPICGFLHLIPHFGPAAALILGMLAALLSGMSWERFAILAGVYVAVFTFEGYWLSPRILGRRLHLRPLWVFLAVLAGGAVFGFVGLLLAVPALAIALVIYRFFFGPGHTRPG